MKEYPTDFAVPGTAGALSALVKQIISNTHLLHYGSDFLPFLEQLSTLQDTELSWALPVTDILDDSDDSDAGDFEDASSFIHSHASSMFGAEVPLPLTSSPQFIEPPDGSDSLVPPRGRRMSEPLSSMGLLGSPRLTRAHALSSASENQRNSAIPLSRTPSRDLLKELLRVATNVNAMTPLDIAREITRVDLQHFLDIEVRTLHISKLHVLTTIFSHAIGFDMYCPQRGRIQTSTPSHASTRSSTGSQIGLCAFLSSLLLRIYLVPAGSHLSFYATTGPRTAHVKWRSSH